MTREQAISVYVGVLAALLTVCSLGGGNAQQDAMLRSIATANNWAFFQAKNVRREIVALRADDEASAVFTKELDELYRKGKELETDRDEALARGQRLDRGAALLQIAIVLASVAAVVGGWSLLVGSGIAALVGTAAAVAGFL